MKINIIKYHPFYEMGEVEVEDGRAAYLLAVGVAEEVKEKKEHSKIKEKKEGGFPKK